MFLPKTAILKGPLKQFHCSYWPEVFFSYFDIIFYGDPKFEVRSFVVST